MARSEKNAECTVLPLNAKKVNRVCDIEQGIATEFSYGGEFTAV